MQELPPSARRCSGAVAHAARAEPRAAQADSGCDLWDLPPPAARKRSHSHSGCVPRHARAAGGELETGPAPRRADGSEGSTSAPASRASEAPSSPRDPARARGSTEESSPERLWPDTESDTEECERYEWSPNCRRRPAATLRSEAAAASWPLAPARDAPAEVGSAEADGPAAAGGQRLAREVALQILATEPPGAGWASDAAALLATAPPRRRLEQAAAPPRAACPPWAAAASPPPAQLVPPPSQLALGARPPAAPAPEALRLLAARVLAAPAADHARPLNWCPLTASSPPVEAGFPASPPGGRGAGAASAAERLQASMLAAEAALAAIEAAEAEAAWAGPPAATVARAAGDQEAAAAASFHGAERWAPPRGGAGGCLAAADRELRDGVTSLMLRNLPCRLTQRQLLAEVHRTGFAGRCDFCYMPRDFASGENQGHAFLNFTSTAAAVEFNRAWSQRPLCAGQRTGPAGIDISVAAVQGLAANAAKWDIPRMKRVRNPDYKPFILERDLAARG